MKKFLVIVVVIIFFVLFGTFWNIVSQGYDRQNQAILFIKKILPSHTLREIKKTIFFIPDLKEKNRILELQVKKFEQGLNGELFAEKSLVTNLDKKFEVKEFFYLFQDWI